MALCCAMMMMPLTTTVFSGPDGGIGHTVTVLAGGRLWGCCASAHSPPPPRVRPTGSWDLPGGAISLGGTYLSLCHALKHGYVGGTGVRMAASGPPRSPWAPGTLFLCLTAPVWMLGWGISL